ncbi:MAG: helix-turn-helix transcriptional regulator [Candidatus Entotheonellia bacterium]
MLATLKLALDRSCVAQVAWNVTSALQQLTNGPPKLLLVHTSLPPAECSRLLHVMRSSYPDCHIFFISSKDPTFALRSEFASFPRYENIEDPLRFRALSQEIFALISIGRAAGDLPPSLTFHITKAMCYIGNHYAEAFTVKAIAHAIGVSEGYLAHLFSAEVEMSVKQCVTRVRIEVAKQLLLDRRYTLEHIAEMVGFHDGPRLSRTFRRFTGLAPGDYRRQIGCI